jgi:hypothetical protein
LPTGDGAFLFLGDSLVNEVLDVHTIL